MKYLYCVRDRKSGAMSPINIEDNDDNFIRSFGISLQMQKIPASFASDFEGVKLGEIETPEGLYPRVRGYECPVPLITGDAAMAPYNDFNAEVEDDG